VVSGRPPDGRIKEKTPISDYWTIVADRKLET
jgi:hypothetical protein